jgi:hypothetical protein
MSPPAYDGVHLIAELVEAEGLDDLPRIERALRSAAAAARATLIDLPCTPSDRVKALPASRCSRSRTSRSIAGRSMAMPRSISSCAAGGAIRMRRSR